MNTTIVALALRLASQDFDLPEGLLDAICWVESSHRPQVVHKDDGRHNSLGLCQVQLRTAKGLGYRGTEKDLMAPKINAYYAAKYLYYQYQRYGDWDLAVIAYNRGNANGVRTSAYLQRVKQAYANGP